MLEGVNEVKMARVEWLGSLSSMNCCLVAVYIS